MRMESPIHTCRCLELCATRCWMKEASGHPRNSRSDCERGYECAPLRPDSTAVWSTASLRRRAFGGTVNEIVPA